MKTRKMSNNTTRNAKKANERFGQYYHVCYCWSASKFPQILKENGKDAEWLRAAFRDERKRKEFLAFKCLGDAVGKIEYLTYSTICYDLFPPVVQDYYKQAPYTIDNKSYFLNKAKAKAALDEDLKNEISEFFLQGYDKEF